ncbi:MAG: chromate transporter [Acidobacteriota bacterium]|nr:chromate transporter [Acidobacteriota bacterium]
MPDVSLRAIAVLFLRVGTTTFGGGDPSTAVLQREFQRRRWLDSHRLGIAYGLARITPGTNMLAFCAATGWYLKGWAGTIAAVLGVTIPSTVLIVLLTRVCESGGQVPWLRAALAGTIAAAVGLTAAAAFVLVRTHMSKRDWLVPVIVAGGAFALSTGLALNPILILGLAALVGFFWKSR